MGSGAKGITDDGSLQGLCQLGLAPPRKQSTWFRVRKASRDEPRVPAVLKPASCCSCQRRRSRTACALSPTQHLVSCTVSFSAGALSRASTLSTLCLVPGSHHEPGSRVADAKRPIGHTQGVVGTPGPR